MSRPTKLSTARAGKDIASGLTCIPISTRPAVSSCIPSDGQLLQTKYCELTRKHFDGLFDRRRSEIGAWRSAPPRFTQLSTMTTNLLNLTHTSRNLKCTDL